MSLAHGHQDRKYNPKNKAEVRKIKDYIKEKLAEGWILYGMKAGEKIMKQIANVKGIDDKELDRFILAGRDAVKQKMLAAPIKGGQDNKMNDVARYSTLLFYKNDDQIGGLDEKEQKELAEIEEKLRKNEEIVDRLKTLLKELGEYEALRESPMYLKLQKILGEKNE